MLEETKTELPLMQKVIHTAVLTGISALILGFFSFFGWLGVTMVKIQDNQTKIIQDLKYKELKESKTVDVLSSELFEAKQRIAQLESSNTPFEDTIEDTIDQSDDSEISDVPRLKVEKDLEKYAIEEIEKRLKQKQTLKQQQSQRKELEQYQQQIQQQRIVSPEQFK